MTPPSDEDRRTMLRSGKILRSPKIDAINKLDTPNQPTAQSSDNVKVQTHISRAIERTAKVFTIGEPTIMAGTAINDAEYPYDAEDPDPIADGSSERKSRKVLKNAENTVRLC